MRNILLATAAIVSFGFMTVPAFAASQNGGGNAYPEGEGVKTFDVDVVDTTGNNTSSNNNDTGNGETASIDTSSISSTITSVEAEQAAAAAQEQQTLNANIASDESSVDNYAAAQTRIDDGTDTQNINNAVSAYYQEGYGGDQSSATKRLASCSGNSVSSCTMYIGTYTENGQTYTYKNAQLYNLDTTYEKAVNQQASDQSLVNGYSFSY